MSQKVGEIFYEVSLETGTMIEGQRKVRKELDSTSGSLQSFSGGLTKVSAAIAVVVAAAGAMSRALFQASAEGDRLKTMLDFATAGRGAQEIGYLREVTHRLGLEFSTTATAYGQFQAAAKGTSIEGQKAKDIFESISKASAVMGLSADQSKGALLALQQMISKGTVQSEELRGQLGERLPGAFQIAAKAMGVTTAELGKMLEAGQVVADDFLPKFAAALNEHIGDASENAANRLDASVNRMNSAYERMKQNAGDTGISKFIAGQYEILADAMGGVSEAMENARRNGSGFAGQMSAGASAAASFINPLQAFSYSAIEVGNALKQAEAEFAALKKQGDTRGGGFYYEAELGNLAELIKKLREAKEAQDKLSKAPQTSQSESRIKASNAYAEQEEKNRAKSSEWMRRYATDIERVNAEIAKAKKELGDAFTPELEQRIRAKIMPDKKTATPKESPDEKYTESLQKQLEKEQELTEVQKLGFEINYGRLGKLTVAQQNALVVLAMKVDAEKRENELQKEGKKLNEEAVKQSEEYVKTQVERTVSMYESNEALRLHGQEIGLTKEALNALELARIDDAIAIQQQAAAQLEGVSGEEAEIERIQRYIAALRERKSLTASNQIKQAAADTSKEQQDAAKRFADDLHGDVKNALSNAFRDTKDPISAFGDALGNVIYTRVANSLADAMLTSNVGTSVMSGLTSLFSFGGARAYGGPANSGSLYRVNEKGAPEMFTASNGSQYMMPTKSGRVTAADKVGGGGATINITMNTSVGDIASKSDVIKGMRATASQIAAQISRSKNYGGAMS